MLLIVITPDYVAVDEAEIINSLFAGGLQRLHLRKPSFAIGDYRKYIEAIDSKWHNRIVVHGCYELYHQYHLGGIHLSSYAREDSDTWQQIKDVPPPVISTSFHTWDEIKNNRFPYGYVFISPVFDSISKAGYKAGIDLTKAKEIRQQLVSESKYCPSIIGLGGVAIGEITTLYEYGFDGAAMLGTIWESENPVNIFTAAIAKAALLQDG